MRLTRNQLLIVAGSMLVTATVAVIFAMLSPAVFNTSRSIIVYSGNNPNDNDILSTAIESIVKSKGMAAEVKRRGDFPETIDQIDALIGTDRSPESPYMDIVVSSPDKQQSEDISAQVIPSLRSVFESNQRQIPVDQRISGPIFQEVFTFPLQSTSTFPAWFAAIFGALLGGLVPYLFFLYRNLRKPVLASAQDVTEALDLPVLVKVPVLTGRLAELDCPVLGFWGLDEKMMPENGIMAMARNIPQLRLVLVSECGHWVMVEHEAMFNRYCLDFLKNG